MSYGVAVIALTLTALAAVYQPEFVGPTTGPGFLALFGVALVGAGSVLRRRLHER
jgi:hypothetical protein